MAIDEKGVCGIADMEGETREGFLKQEKKVGGSLCMEGKREVERDGG